MTRSTTFIAVVCGMCVLAASAAAGQKHRKDESGSENNNTSPKFLQKYNQVRGLGQQMSSGNLMDTIASFKKHHKHEKPEKPDDRVPIDPGKGDGQTGNPTPQSTGGFVWVGDHWERARASKGTQTLVPPVVRDHGASTLPPLSGGNGQGGVTVTGTPVVRDHRTQSVSVEPIVRDHRTLNVEPIVRDHRTPQPFEVLPLNGFDQPIIRDHRTKSEEPQPFQVTGTSGQPVVRDHRTLSTPSEPVVRDHRTLSAPSEPVVRDHRASSGSGSPISASWFAKMADLITP
jgi:hypothetical protein